MGLVLFLLSPSPHSPHKRSHPLFCVHFHQISSYNGTHPTKDHRSVFVACYQAVHLLIYTDGLINAVYLIADKINVFSTLQWHPVTGSAKSMAYYHMFHFSHILYHLNRFAMSRSQTSLWWAKSGQVTGHRGPPGEKNSVTGRLRRHVPPRKPLKNE